MRPQSLASRSQGTRATWARACEGIPRASDPSESDGVGQPIGAVRKPDDGARGSPPPSPLESGRSWSELQEEASGERRTACSSDLRQNDLPTRANPQRPRSRHRYEVIGTHNWVLRFGWTREFIRPVSPKGAELSRHAPGKALGESQAPGRCTIAIGQANEAACASRPDGKSPKRCRRPSSKTG